MDTDRDLKRRLIDFATLDTPAKRVLLVGTVVLIALAGATIARDLLPGPLISAAHGVEYPAAVLAIAACGVALSMTFLLAGTIQANTEWRAALIVPVGLLAALAIAIVPPVSGEPPLAFAAAIVVNGAIIIYAGPWLGQLGRLIVAGTYAAAIWGYALIAVPMGSDLYGPSLVFYFLGLSVIALMPAFYLVGLDITEVGAEASERGLRRASRAARAGGRLAVRALLTVAGFFVAALLYVLHGSDEPLVFLAQLGALVLLSAAIVWSLDPAGAARRHAEYGFSYWRSFVLVAVLVGTSWTAWTYQAPDPAYFNYTGVRAFALPLGDQWRHIEQDNDPELKFEQDPFFMVRHRFHAVSDERTAFFVMAVPREMVDGTHPVLATVNEVMKVKALPPMPMSFAPDETLAQGGSATTAWRHGEADGRLPSGKIVHALYWKKEVITPMLVTSADWYLVCSYLATTAATSRPLCEDIRDRFLLRNVYRSSVTAKLVFNSLIWIGAIALALTLLRLAPGWRGGLEFFLFVAAVAAARGAGSFSAHAGDSFESVHLSAGILTVVLTLACIAYAAANVAQWLEASPARAAAQHICELFLAALIAASVLFILYVYAAEGSEHSHEIRGAIVCAALTWELWMSGAAGTNRQTPLMPRGARIMALIGYLLLVGSCTFFFVTTTLPYSEQTWHGFDAETLVAAGIACLGIPYLLLRHFDRFRRAVPETYAFT